MKIAILTGSGWLALLLLALPGCKKSPCDEYIEHRGQLCAADPQCPTFTDERKQAAKAFCEQNLEPGKIQCALMVSEYSGMRRCGALDE